MGERKKHSQYRQKNGSVIDAVELLSGQRKKSDVHLNKTFSPSQYHIGRFNKYMINHSQMVKTHRGM